MHDVCSPASTTSCYKNELKFYLILYETKAPPLKKSVIINELSDLKW
jgi:hypothetical protein